MVKIQIFISGVSLFLFVITIGLIKKRVLKEEYSVIWIIAETVLFIFGAFPRILTFVAGLFGIYYLTAIFIIAFLFLLVIAFYYSIILSRLSETNRALVQEIGLLKLQCEKSAKSEKT